MPSDSIYLMSEHGLVELRNEPYESEDLLQQLLARYPDLLAGGQMNTGEPRRWLLVRRELGVPADKERPAAGALITSSSTKMASQPWWR